MAAQTSKLGRPCSECRRRLATPAVLSVIFGTFWALLFLLYLSVQGVTPGFPRVFSVIFAIAHAAEFALSLFIVLWLLSFWPGRLAGVLSILPGFGLSLYFIANYFVYRQFRLHITMAMVGLFFSEAGGDIFVFPVVMYVQAAAAGLAILAASAGSWLLARRLAARPRPGLKIAGAFYLVSILAFHGLTVWSSFHLYTPITTQLSALPLVQPLTMTRMLRRLGFEPAADLPRFSAKTMNYPLESLRFEKPEKLLNIVVIMIDGWRFDMMTVEVTPNIYAFSRRCLRFTLHNAAANHSRHGVFSFFYGLPGTYWKAALAGRGGPVLVEALNEYGYDLGIYGSASFTSPEFDRTVFAEVKGLELSTSGNDTTARDQEITRKFLRLIENREKGKPFFSFLFYDSTHAFAYDPSLYRPKFLPDDDKNYFSANESGQALAFNRYKNSAGFIDLLVKRVLDGLETGGFLENTVVVITADHGDEFDELGLGYSGHNGNFSKYQTQVPMLIYWPGREAADYGHLTSHLDVVPTLMRDVLGCLSPEELYSNGGSLFQPRRDYAFMMGPNESYGILENGVITVFPLVGSSYAVEAETYRPVERSLAPELYYKILQDISRFKR
jgi:membrane-anchored protein YejM (alkaline phosphatase superfamily)